MLSLALTISTQCDCDCDCDCEEEYFNTIKTATIDSSGEIIGAFYLKKLVSYACFSSKTPISNVFLYLFLSFCLLFGRLSSFF